MNQTGDYMNLKLLGRKIRQVRKDNKISQKAIAEAAGIVRATYQRVERDPSRVALDSVYKVLKVLGLEIDLISAPDQEQRLKDLPKIDPIDEGWVYCAYDPETDLVKIGKTTNPKERVKALRNSTPYIVMEFLQYCKNMSRAENRLHLFYKNYRSHGEWFEVDLDDAKESLDTICQKINLYQE